MEETLKQLEERFLDACMLLSLSLNTRLPLSNILVAQGYLSGSSFLQNDGEDLLNRKLLRRKVPDCLLGQ